MCTKQIDQLQPPPLKHSNLSATEQKALRDLQKRTDVVIKPADKGGAITIWKRDLYLKEAHKQLSDSASYREIPEATTKADNTLIRKTIKCAVEDGNLPPEAFNAVNREPKEPHFYLLPKIHKPNTPGRPIVSACACPTVFISDTLDKIFQPLVARLPTYVKDTNHTLRLLRDFKFPDNRPERYIFTMDITALYTSIPHHDGLEAVKHFLERYDCKLHIPTILRLTELVLKLNSFSFQDRHFIQTRGVAMGTKMGPSFACLFVGYVEDLALKNYKKRVPLVFKRYIDDCLGATVGPKQELLDFIHHMSTFHPALQYTYEISSTSLPFLDLFITIQPDSPTLSTSVYYKPTDSHSYLLYSSSHPETIRNSIPHSQFQRLRRICSSEDDFKHQSEKMSTFFTARQYPRQMVQKGLEHALLMSRADALLPNAHTKSEDRVVAIIPFHPHNIPVYHILKNNFKIIQQDSDLSGIFPKPPLIAFKRDKNIKDLLVRSRMKTTQGPNNPNPPGCKPCDDKKCKTCPFVNTSTSITGPSGTFNIRSSFTCKSTNIVYVLACSLCTKMYVGETYRSLNDRFTEHLRSMKLNYQNPIGQHFNSPQHSYAHAQISAVWQNTKDAKYRKHMENSIINRLGTVQPAGLNSRAVDL